MGLRATVRKIEKLVGPMLEEEPSIVIINLGYPTSFETRRLGKTYTVYRNGEEVDEIRQPSIHVFIGREATQEKLNKAIEEAKAKGISVAFVGIDDD